MKAAGAVSSSEVFGAPLNHAGAPRARFPRGNQWSRRSSTGGQDPVSFPALSSARCRAPVVASLAQETAQPASASQATARRNALPDASLPVRTARRSSGRPTEHDHGGVTAPVAALRRGGQGSRELANEKPNPIPSGARPSASADRCARPRPTDASPQACSATRRRFDAQQTHRRGLWVGARQQTATSVQRRHGSGSPDGSRTANRQAALHACKAKLAKGRSSRPAPVSFSRERHCPQILRLFFPFPRYSRRRTALSSGATPASRTEDERSEPR